MSDETIKQIQQALAHQDRQIEDLSEMVIHQNKEIEALNLKILKLQGKFEAFQESAESENPDAGLSVSEIAARDKPPHY